jgi:hypothetical protein
MSNYLDLSSSFIHWNPSFNRVARDWELESFDSFFSLLYSSKRRIRGKWTTCCGLPLAARDL